MEWELKWNQALSLHKLINMLSDEKKTRRKETRLQQNDEKSSTDNRKKRETLQEKNFFSQSRDAERILQIMTMVTN